MNKATSGNSQENLLKAICNQSLSFNPRIAVYQRNRWALAERALAISFPTIAKLIGDSFSLLTREFLFAHPNEFSDWGEWGEKLPDFIANQVSTSHLAYLPNVAALDWCIHKIERTDNDEPISESISLLSELDPSLIGIKFNTNIRFLWTNHPIFEIWQMHQPNEEFSKWSESAREKLQNLSSQNCVVVSRSQWKAIPTVISSNEYKFMSALLRGGSLLDALTSTENTDFDLSIWLPNALSNAWITEFHPLTTPTE